MHKPISLAEAHSNLTVFSKQLFQWSAMGMACDFHGIYLADAHCLEATSRGQLKRVWTWDIKSDPPSIESNCLLPVEILTTLFLFWASSAALTNPLSAP